MAKNIYTQKQLDKLNEDAFNFLKEWIKYMEALGNFTVLYSKALKEGTTPPGSKPPLPPGIP